MRRPLWFTFVVALAVVGVLAAGVTDLGAQNGGPQPTSLIPPRPGPALDSPDTPTLSTTTTQSTAFSGLKAVLIVGPIDGDTGTWTRQEIANMELAATVLQAQGVAVQRFYTPNNDWNAIVAASHGAHFLLYRGHGVAWNNVPDVGGFSLKDRMISPEEIARDLALAPNAIVMLYACYAAGGGSSDTSDIGIVEARRRVEQYAAPFLARGAAGYYANWVGDAFEKFLGYLFAGRTLGGAYEAYPDFNAATVSRSVHPLYPDLAMWLDKDDWAGYWQYDNAFVGRADKTLGDLFLGAELGGMPQELNFVYSLVDKAFVAGAYAVVPKNVASGLPLTWSVGVNGSWVNVSPTMGTTPNQAFVVSPYASALANAGTYTGTIRVICQTTGESVTIDVSLDVVNRPLQRVFLPLVAMGMTTR